MFYLTWVYWETVAVLGSRLMDSDRAALRLGKAAIGQHVRLAAYMTTVLCSFSLIPVN